MLTFLAVQAFLFLSWLLWLGGRRPALLCTPALLVAASLFFFAQIVVTSTMLGILGYLEPAVLIPANLAVGLLPMLATLLRRIKAPQPGDVLPAGRRFPAMFSFPVVLNLGLTLLLLLAVVLTVMLAMELGPYTTDGLWYHVPMVFFMRQHRGFTPVGLPLIDSYPHNGELWQHWILSFFGSDRWLDLHQLPFVFLMLLAVYSIARRLRISPALSYGGALLTAFTPVVLAQLGAELVDVVNSALLIASVAALLESRESERRWLWALAFGLGIGLLAGTKFTGLVYAVVLFAAWLCLVLPAPVLALSALTAAFACGGYVYTANFLHHGNPLYPYHIALPLLNLPGPYEFHALWEAKATAGTSYPQRLLASWLAVGQTGYGWHTGGLGVTWLLLLSAVPVAVWHAYRRRAFTFLALAGLFVMLFALTPVSYSARFVIFVVSFGALSWAAVQADRPASWMSTLLQSLALLCAVYTVWQYVLFLAYQMSERQHADQPACPANAFPQAFLPAYRWVDQHLGDGQTLVAFIDGQWEMALYCLWNSRRSNNVELGWTVKDLNREAIFFIPHTSSLYGQFLARQTQYQVLAVDQAVTIAKRLQFK